jgi:tRNA threonylcarbamoyladenosine biosynthesis protein TsaE
VILDRPIEIGLADAAATGALGARLANSLEVGDAVLLTGGLGAGKSTLARGLIRALTGPDEDVPSPTFTLVQFYEGGRLPVAHFDLYRLSAPEEAYELGIDEALETGAILVEWPQRLGAGLPADRLDIELSEDGDGRIAKIAPHGSWKGRELG